MWPKWRLRGGRSRPSASHVAVVDGTGLDVGGQVCLALAADGLAAQAVDVFDLAEPSAGLVLLVPGHTDLLADATQHVFTVISGLSTDPEPASRIGAKIVLAWHVPHGARRKLAAPRDTRPWNAADLLLGTSWQRELRRHHGDLAAAVDCRSQQVAKLMLTGSNRYLGGKHKPELCDGLRRLDQRYQHALSVQVAEYHDDGVRFLWTGGPSIAAAVKARITHSSAGSRRPARS